ncbi:4471_t:CDS:2 [Dentiscutata heterogama]|uniref:4471_t:CDS:1 n=1 Tax=Dentiscutata heterogama TaxID=1316150 RepID=A0ACA9MSF7_9GLOM|nr:4471_t:CDS:2 [Dentiscutata heterogama]
MQQKRAEVARSARALIDLDSSEEYVDSDDNSDETVDNDEGYGDFQDQDDQHLRTYQALDYLRT